MKVYSCKIADSLGIDAIMSFEAIAYDSDLRHVFVVGDKTFFPNIEFDDKERLILWIDQKWVAIESKGFYKKGVKRLQAKANLHKYFSENLPPFNVKIGEDVPKLEDIKVEIENV